MYYDENSTYFTARSLIIAGNKGLYSLHIVHIWKETDKHVKTEIYIASLFPFPHALYLFVWLIYVIPLYLMSMICLCEQGWVANSTPGITSGIHRHGK